jgi:hypothetical protein
MLIKRKEVMNVKWGLIGWGRRIPAGGGRGIREG